MKKGKGRAIFNVVAGVIAAWQLGGCAVHAFTERGYAASPRAERIRFQKRVSSKRAASIDSWRPHRTHRRYRELVDYLELVESRRVERSPYR